MKCASDGERMGRISEMIDVQWRHQSILSRAQGLVIIPCSRWNFASSNQDYTDGSNTTWWLFTLSWIELCYVTANQLNRSYTTSQVAKWLQAQVVIQNLMVFRKPDDYDTFIVLLPIHFTVSAQETNIQQQTAARRNLWPVFTSGE